MSGRKTFVGGDILLASELNGFLMDQSVMVFDDAAARTTAIPSPSEGMVTYLKDTDALFSYSASAWVPAVNTASIADGNVTTAKLGAGTILQVVQTFKTDTFAMASNTLSNVTGLSVSITPRATSSRIFVSVNISSSQSDGAGNNGFGVAVVNRTPGDVLSPIGDSAASRTRTTVAITGSTLIRPGSFDWLDSPNSTSALTYQVQVRRRSEGTVLVNRDFGDGDSIFSVRGVSSITVMEVAG
jgi:hypothetical protein